MMVLTAGSQDGIECSVHTLPKPLLREFRHVFADKYLMVDGMSQNGLELLALPTNQHAMEDLVAIGEHIEREKDRLLNVVSLCIVSWMGFFRLFATNVRDDLHTRYQSHH
jgi:hypothetical protein